MRHAVIMAGGAGVRLWPLSRKHRPKQTLRLFEKKSLIRHSFERVAALLPPEQIHVISNDAHLPMIRKELPELSEENLIGEPVGRDTANAVGLACAILHAKDRNAVIGVFTADHIISPVDAFCSDIERAFVVAEQNEDALVTLGIRPTRPDTGYGYIRRADRLADGVYVVAKFAEKPNMASAMKYVATGEYYWNSGMFAWRAATVLEQIKKHIPQTYDAVQQVAATSDPKQRTATLAELYPKLMRISIDFAVMERADRVLVVELGCHWVDVGAWTAIESIIGADADGNVSACEKVMHLGSRGNIVVSEEPHLVATIGVDDLVIVHSPDATLICKRRDAQAIKELVNNIHQAYGDEYE